jgi:hypothetical protein
MTVLERERDERAAPPVEALIPEAGASFNADDGGGED